MGCNNSHLRPFFRRCRRRSKKDESNCTPKRQQNDLMIDSNHADANSSNDLLHGFHFIGSSMRNSPLSAKLGADVSASDAPVCVPLLAQSEVSHSQIDFFKMLDDKIQEGPDYDSEEDKVETERLIKKNLETWNRTIDTNGWKSGGTDYNKLGNNSSSSKNGCQWDDDGDGG